MAAGAGYPAYIGVGEESTFGTGVAPTKFFRLVDESLSLDYGKHYREILGSNLTRKTISKKKSVGGSFKILAPFDDLGILFKHALGDVSTSGVGPYTHTITAVTSLPTGLSIQVNRDTATITGNASFRYTGCQISKLTLTQAMEEFCEVTVDVVGTDLSLVSAASPSYAADNYADWENNTTIELNSVSQCARSVELSIENQLRENRYCLGSLTRTGLGRRQSMVTAKVDVEWDSLDEYNLFLNQTDTPVSIAWSGASSYSLTCALSSSNVQAANVNASDTDDIIIPVEIEGNLEDLTVTLVNGDASY